MPLTRAPATVSAVIVTLNEGTNLRSTVESYQRTLPEGSEIVVVDDGSDDGSTEFLRACNGSVRLLQTRHLGVARARNLGARSTTGDAIVFSDAHIDLPENWAARLLEALADPTPGGA